MISLDALVVNSIFSYTTRERYTPGYLLDSLHQLVHQYSKIQVGSANAASLRNRLPIRHYDTLRSPMNRVPRFPKPRVGGSNPSRRAPENAANCEKNVGHD